MLKIIDANSGDDLKVGDKWKNIHGDCELLALKDCKHFSFILIKMKDWPQGIWAPLTVRDGDHPGFPNIRVGFINS